VRAAAGARAFLRESVNLLYSVAIVVRVGPDLVLSRLKELYPNPRHYLTFRNPFELLVATILSAQCPDETVNAVTEKLFRKYRTPEDFEGLPLAQLETDIHSINFFRNKAKAIKEASTIIVERYHGKVPDDMESLTKLPGIGRKSANAILAHGFDRVQGIIVDTHVIRLARRLGWSAESDPDRIEQDLMKLLDQQEWKSIPFYLKSHGKAVCKAQKPLCQECALNKMCLSALRI
jgi:endonuclease-3